MVGCQGRDWGTGILLPQDFSSEIMQAVMGQQILQSPSWRPGTDQKARELWAQDWYCLKQLTVGAICFIKAFYLLGSFSIFSQPASFA